MSKKIIPATGRLLIKPLSAKSSGGIILSGEAHEHAEILAIGTGKLIIGGDRLKSEFKVGDIVVYGNRADSVDEELEGSRVILVVTEAIIATVVEVKDGT